MYFKVWSNSLIAIDYPLTSFSSIRHDNPVAARGPGSSRAFGFGYLPSALHAAENCPQRAVFDVAMARADPLVDLLRRETKRARFCQHLMDCGPQCRTPRSAPLKPGVGRQLSLKFEHSLGKRKQVAADQPDLALKPNNVWLCSFRQIAPPPTIAAVNRALVVSKGQDRGEWLRLQTADHETSIKPAI